MYTGKLLTTRRLQTVMHYGITKPNISSLTLRL